MARFGRMFALGSGDGKTVSTKTCPSSLQRLSRTLSAEKKRLSLRFFTFPVKSTRVLLKEIELSGRCKTTVICGIKSMTNTANVENAGSINNPPGCLIFGGRDYINRQRIVFLCFCDSVVVITNLRYPCNTRLIIASHIIHTTNTNK